MDGDVHPDDNECSDHEGNNATSVEPEASLANECGITETPNLMNTPGAVITGKKSRGSANKELDAFFVKLAAEVNTPKSITDESDKSLHTEKDTDGLTGTEVSLACMRAGCKLEFNQHMLVCGKCEKFIHYGCTQLPGYQIKQFKSKNYRKYKCESCVGELPDDIKLNCAGDNLKTLKETCHVLEKAAAEREKELDTLRTKHQGENKCTQTTTTWTSNEALMREKDKIANDLNLKNWELDRVNNEKVSLKKDNIALKQKVAYLAEEEGKLRNLKKASDFTGKDYNELKKAHGDLVKSLHTARGELSEAQTKCEEYQEQLKFLRNNESALRNLLDERENELDKLHTVINGNEQLSPKVQTDDQVRAMEEEVEKIG